MRPFLGALLLLVCTAVAAQQLRTIPPDAKAGTLRHLQDMTVALDGKPEQLAPGAQIRDTANRLVLPGAIPPTGVLVKYKRNDAGVVNQVWLLTQREAAQLPQAPAPQSER